MVQKVIIENTDWGLMAGFEEAPQRIISDLTKLDFDFVPDKLVHRDDQMKQMFSAFKTAVEIGSAQKMLLTGGVGTGKSVLSKRFCLDFQDWAKTKGKRVEFVIVNCRTRNTSNSVLLKILEKFQPHFPDRGFSNIEMLEILRKDISKDGIVLIVLLDEVDVLIKKSGSDLLYSLSRFNDESTSGSKPGISLILISQKQIHDFMDPATISTIKRTNQIRFDKYSKSELRDILVQRVGLAFFPGTVDDDIVEFIADVASDLGDARFAIELLENAGRIASDEGEDCVMPEHVRTAKATTYSVVTESKLASLDRSSLLTLLAVCRTIRKKTFITTGKVEENYKMVCEEYECKARSHTQFWEYLQTLGNLGLLGLQTSGKGLVGKTTLISLPDVPAKVMEEKILALLKGVNDD